MRFFLFIHNVGHSPGRLSTNIDMIQCLTPIGSLNALSGPPWESKWMCISLVQQLILNAEVCFSMLSFSIHDSHQRALRMHQATLLTDVGMYSVRPPVTYSFMPYYIMFQSSWLYMRRPMMKNYCPTAIIRYPIKAKHILQSMELWMTEILHISLRIRKFELPFQGNLRGSPLYGYNTSSNFRSYQKYNSRSHMDVYSDVRFRTTAEHRCSSYIVHIWYGCMLFLHSWVP